MRVVIVVPGQYPRIEDIDLTLEKEQEIVGGLITTSYPWEEQVGIISNDESLLLGMPFNRAIEHYGPIFGSFLIAGLSAENFCGLTEEQAQRYSQMFHSPEILFDFFGTPRIFRCPPDEYKRIMDAVNKNSQEPLSVNPPAPKTDIPER